MWATNFFAGTAGHPGNFAGAAGHPGTFNGFGSGLPLAGMRPVGNPGSSPWDSLGDFPNRPLIPRDDGPVFPEDPRFPEDKPHKPRDDGARKPKTPSRRPPGSPFDWAPRAFVPGIDSFAGGVYEGATGGRDLETDARDVGRVVGRGIEWTVSEIGRGNIRDGESDHDNHGGHDAPSSRD